MKTIATKKKIFYSSAILSLLIIVLDQVGTYKICGEGNFVCVGNLANALRALFPVVVIFLLSLITYKMREKVFRAWWNFARWWVLVIILVTYLQSTQGGGGGMGIGGAMSSAFDAVILGFFYVVLFVVSLWRIIRKYRQLKREGK